MVVLRVGTLERHTHLARDELADGPSGAAEGVASRLCWLGHVLQGLELLGSELAELLLCEGAAIGANEVGKFLRFTRAVVEAAISCRCTFRS